MKQKIAIIILFLACLALPQTFLSQTNSKSQKAAKTSKSKTDRGKLQAKKIIEQFIDGVFVEKNSTATFERLVSFEPCDRIDKAFGEMSENCDPSKYIPSGLGHKLMSRLIGTGWRKSFNAFRYILGTIPIPESNLAYPYSSAEYDIIESKVISKNLNSAFAFDFSNLTKLQIEDRLTKIESILDEIELLLEGQIDSDLYRANLEQLKKGIQVTRVVRQNRTYYVASLDHAIFGFILSVRNREMKIIGIGAGV
jgi:hypothetical protein